MTPRLGSLALLVAALAFPSHPVAAQATPRRPPAVAAAPEPRLLYTTYFYTAGEAIVQGYANGTHVRIFALASREPIYAGTLDEGESVLVPTGTGVFGFVSDRKAAILVGTPSSCTVVGYFGRDEDGSFVSDRMFVQLPSSSSSPDDRVVVWAAEASHVTVRDQTSGERVFEGDLPARGRFVIPHERLVPRNGHVLDVRSDHRSVAVQVYYDEGFTVPSTNGRAIGREFFTYVGRTTEGVNDVVVTSYRGTAHVRIEDLDSGEVLFEGDVEQGSAHATTLHERYVRVRSDRDVATSVVPYEHYRGGYAEHHFSGGSEGTGIDAEFLVTTPAELWIFSYFAGNHVTVENAVTGERVFDGTLGAGQSTGLEPGHGFYRVRASGGASVMGGASSCGGEYSPAGGLFAVDDAVMRAVAEVHEQRRRAAAARGETLSPAAAAAPLTPAELRSVTEQVQRATGSRVYDAAAVRERLDAIQAE